MAVGDADILQLVMRRIVRRGVNVRLRGGQIPGHHITGVSAEGDIAPAVSKIRCGHLSAIGEHAQGTGILAGVFAQVQPARIAGGDVLYLSTMNRLRNVRLGSAQIIQHHKAAHTVYIHIRPAAAAVQHGHLGAVGIQAQGTGVLAGAFAQMQLAGVAGIHIHGCVFRDHFAAIIIIIVIIIIVIAAVYRNNIGD